MSDSYHVTRKNSAKLNESLKKIADCLRYSFITDNCQIMFYRGCGFLNGNAYTKIIEAIQEESGFDWFGKETRCNCFDCKWGDKGDSEFGDNIKGLCWKHNGEVEFVQPPKDLGCDEWEEDTCCAVDINETKIKDCRTCGYRYKDKFYKYQMCHDPSKNCVGWNHWVEKGETE